MPEIEINAMTFGPFGVGRHDGKAVMVPDAVRRAIAWRSRSFRSGATTRSRRFDEIVARERRAPRAAPCPFLPRCGGCDWQHIDYAAQVRFKGEVVARELSHALGIEIDPVGLVEPAPAEFGYRSRIRLKVGARQACSDFTSSAATRSSRSIHAWSPRPASGCRSPGALARQARRRDRSGARRRRAKCRSRI